MSEYIKRPYFGLIGSAIRLGQPHSGPQYAPEYLRTSGVIDILKGIRGHLIDFGNVEEDGRTPGAVYKDLHNVSQKAARVCDFTYIIGGDHSQSIGTISGLASVYENLSVVWVDAHGDINTPSKSLTGHLHGMPLAALLGHFNVSSMPDMKWYRPCLKPENLALIGVRELDDYERKILESQKIMVVTAEELKQRGVRAVMRDVLGRIDAKGRNPIHLSLDVDAFDAEFMKATGLPTKGGLSPDEVFELTQILVSTERLKSTELVEFNPLCVKSDEELQSAVRTILRFSYRLLRGAFVKPVFENGALFHSPS